YTRIFHSSSFIFVLIIRRPLRSTLFPYTTLFRSWVLRYLYRGRAFQVVVDGYSGKVLYGKAPGNTIYRAAVLVASMAVGALLARSKSTRLNSSHVKISYAVFCLKKKKIKKRGAN